MGTSTAGAAGAEVVAGGFGEAANFASSAVASASSALSLRICTFRCTSRRDFSAAPARSLAASSLKEPTS